MNTSPSAETATLLSLDLVAGPTTTFLKGCWTNISWPGQTDGCVKPQQVDKGRPAPCSLHCRVPGNKGSKGWVEAGPDDVKSKVWPRASIYTERMLNL